MSSTRAPRGRSLEILIDLIKQDTDDCILWPYGRNAYGYGRLGTKVGGTRAAHRIACQIEHGVPEVGSEAAHSCRNRHCVNPRHLRWATRTENMADKRRDGTDPVGERHGGAKLTEQDVREIRRRAADGTMQSVLADQYRMSRAAVCLIVSRKNWAHVA